LGVEVSKGFFPKPSPVLGWLVKISVKLFLSKE
jgi:hypothetical protein